MYIAYDGGDNPLRPYFNYYYNKLKVGLVMSITGGPFLKTGTGKSWTALKIAEDTDPDFSMEKVVYTPKDFLKVVDGVEELGKSGQQIVVDEGEITAPATMYYSFTNKAIFYTLATFRNLRCGATFVTPSFSWLDKRVRTLVSHWGYTEKKVQNGSTSVRLKLYSVKTDLFGDKIFFNKLKMYNQKTKMIDVFKEFKVGTPNEALTEAYEKKAKDFKKQQRQALIPEIEKWEKYEMQGTQKSKQDIVDEIAGDPKLIESLTTKRGKLDKDLLKDKYPDLTYRDVNQVKRTIEKLWSGGK